MLFILMVPVVVVVSVAHRMLQLYAPSNLIVAHVRRHPPRLWVAGALLMLAVLLLLIAAICSEMAMTGGPGWLHVLFLIALWDAFKFMFQAIAVAGRLGAMVLSRATRQHPSVAAP